ncbi:MAG: peptide ABC transporter substrate-binding protein [Acidimicrobiia bacterium]|nr:peptide ABC transporter substrate-binding protein [Acidimicrobiia bacterium]
MKRMKLFALLAALFLVAAACGSGDDGTGDETTATTAAAGDTTATTAAAPTETTAAAPDTTAAAGGEAGSGGDLLILQWQAPSQANALLSSGTKDLLAGSIILEPLARFSPDGQLVPTLAAAIPSKSDGSFAEDNSSITWTLQEGVLWSDGTPLTADDVVFTYEYCSDELTGCSGDFTTVASVEALDDLTVKVTFVDPQPYPFNDFVGYTEPIIQRAQFADCVGEQASACTDQNFAPIGTGPYMVTDLRPEDTVTYTFNPNYRGIPEGKPFFTNVTIKGGGDAEASARSVLEIGEADYGWNLQVAPEILQPMEAAGNGTILTGFTASVEHINLNQTDPEGNPPSEWMEDGSNAHPILANNPEFARALSLAIDRDALVQVGYGPTGKPICTLWPVGDQQTTNNDWCLTRDVAQANQILDDLGYLDSDGDGVRETDTGLPLEFDFVTSTNAVRQSNQDIIKANWEEIGVAANMSNQDASLFFDGTSASDFSIWKFFSDIEMFTNGATAPDPVGYLFSWTTGEIPTAALGWPASGNMPRMAVPEYDELWNEANQTDLDDPRYNELVIQMQDLMVNSGAVIPLIHRGDVSAISNSIEGFGSINGWDSEYWNIQDWVRAG